MIEIIGLTAVGLAFAVFLGIALIFGIVMAVRAFRKPPPVSQTQAAVPLLPPGYLDAFRPVGPPPGLLDQIASYGSQRQAELDRDRYRLALDKIAGITASPPPPPNP